MSTTGHQTVGSADDTIESRLAGTIPIVKHMFGLSVVNGHGRECQSAVFFHGAQTSDTSGGFFGAAQYFFDLARSFLQKGGDEVGAVVDDQDAACDRGRY